MERIHGAPGEEQSNKGEPETSTPPLDAPCVITLAHVPVRRSHCSCRHIVVIATVSLIWIKPRVKTVGAAAGEGFSRRKQPFSADRRDSSRGETENDPVLHSPSIIVDIFGRKAFAHHGSDRDRTLRTSRSVTEGDDFVRA